VKNKGIGVDLTNKEFELLNFYVF